jgi:hypothetical protein
MCSNVRENSPKFLSPRTPIEREIVKFSANQVSHCSMNLALFYWCSYKQHIWAVLSSVLISEDLVVVSFLSKITVHFYLYDRRRLKILVTLEKMAC